MSERELFVMNSKQGKNRGVKIMDVDFVVHSEEPVVIRRAVCEAAFDASAREPHRESLRIMVAPILSLCRGRSTEFASPNHQSIVKHSP
jgi:hypothetical protein